MWLSSSGLAGVPWTEGEHRIFLLGLQKLGKGDWRGIARNYVISGTPTQVASHAQKYFIKQTNVSRRKRRSSLFDIVADESADAPMVPHDFLSVNDSQAETHSNPPLPAPPALDEECESMESINSSDGDPIPPKTESSQPCYPVVYPAYISPYFPFPLHIGQDTTLQRQLRRRRHMRFSSQLQYIQRA